VLCIERVSFLKKLMGKHEVKVLKANDWRDKILASGGGEG